MKSCLTIKFFFSVALIVGLSSCDKSPIEQVKSITEDKYPVANMPDEPLDKPLEILREPKRLAMTTTWSAGVKDDGTLWTWGTGSLLRKTETGQDPTPRPVDGIHDAVAVSASTSHMLLLRKDGTVWGWGSNHDGEIDPSDDDTSIDELRQIKGIDNVVDISAGSSISFFIKKDGTVYALGKNEAGLFGEVIDKLKIPTKIYGLNNIVKISGMADDFLALNKKGEIFSQATTPQALGLENQQFIKNSNGVNIFPITKLSFNKKAVDLSNGSAKLVLLEDGTVWSWRDTNFTGLGRIKKDFIYKPTRISTLSKVKKVTNYSAMTQNGDLYTWGLYTISCEDCYPNGAKSQYFYKPIKISKNVAIHQFINTDFHNGYIDKDGWLWTWGNNKYATAGTGKLQQTNWSLKESLLTPEKSLFNIH